MFWNKNRTLYIQEMTIKTNLRFYKRTHFLTVVVVVIVELQKSRNIWNNCKIRTESTCSNNIETFICSNCNRIFLWKHKILSNIIWKERGVETVLFRVYKSTFSTQTATFHSTLLKRKFMNYRNTDFNVKTLWKTTSGFGHYKESSLLFIPRGLHSTACCFRVPNVSLTTAASFRPVFRHNRFTSLSDKA